MKKQGKLELTWVGKDERPRLEPRILIEDPTKSYGDPRTENMLIFGDNLLALRALEQEFTGQIKCVSIDPPYNTGNAFENYDDDVEHSIWLSLMRDRIAILRKLLRPDGFFCCHIDDAEGPYLKVLLDEVFGRSNYFATFFIQVRYPEKTLKQDMAFHKEIEQIHVYRKEHGAFPNLNERSASFDKFNYYVVERGSGQSTNIGGKKAVIFKADEYEVIRREGSADGLKEIWATGTILDGNSSGRFFRDYLAGRSITDGLGALYKVYGIGDDKFDYRYFTGPKRSGATKGKYYQGVPMSQLENPDQKLYSPIENFYDLAAQFGNCRHEGGVEFRSGKKPELLLQTILQYFTKPNDWVLDSFAGSGTTGAVSHKMGRRWIMVELGDHCHTHIIPRLKKVIEGQDSSGITEATGWKGGGGFKYYHLAETLLLKDKELGVYVINPKYNAEMLIRAICKIENFRYKIKDRWHGYSSEKRLIHVTTKLLNQKYLDLLANDLGDDQSLLIYSTKKVHKLRLPDNIEVRRIPRDLLVKCEFNAEVK